MNNSKIIGGLNSRREFLGTCGKMTSISMLSTLLQLKMTNSLLALNQNQLSGYKALVCVFLNGGNDSFNMLTPWRNNEHNDYLDVRGDLGLEKSDLLPIYDGTVSNFYGIHHKMPEVRTLYNQTDLAFVANIGTLVRPTSLNDFNNDLHLPRALFSHAEQQQSWQTSVPDQVKQRGWIGRMAELINESGANTGDVRMNISTAGNNLLQTGRNVNPLVISSTGANTLGIYNSAGNVRNAINRSLSEDYRNTIKDHYNHIRKQVIEQNQEFADATSSANINTVFPNTNLGRQLRQVALAIASRNILGARRQTFFVSMSGFDHHADLIIGQESLLDELSSGLSAFNAAMKELGVHDRVTTYTASDFGRSLTGNGDGTDHGWGGNQIVMGGAVNGRRLYGTYPSLRTGTNTDIGRGRQLPTTSVDQFHGELAHWYGIPNNGIMEDILPNIRNFWSNNAAPQLGFLD